MSLEMPAAKPGGVPNSAEMDAIAAIAHRDAGIVISPSKASMVQSRLAKRLRLLKLSDYQSYIALVQSEEGADERRRMISALTTNVSHFFREAHHFDILRNEVFPPLISRLRENGRVRIWSAGCSNGQEAYSIVMTLLDMAPDVAGKDIRVLASDIDPIVLEKGRSATYDDHSISGIPADLAKKFLEQGQGGKRLVPAVRNLISFRELNLHGPWPMKGQFDITFCRNVVIYFDPDAQNKLWKRFATALTPGGWLFVGHSERVPTGPETGLTPSGITSYRLADKNCT